MNDNKDSFDDILQDDYYSQLFKNIPSEAEKVDPPTRPAAIPTKPVQTPKPADLVAGVDEPDEQRFYTFDLSSAQKEIQRTQKAENPNFKLDDTVGINPEDLDRTDIGQGDFRVNFDFEGEYDDAPPEEPSPIRVRREKRTGCLGGLMFAGFIICVSLVLACLVWMAATDVLGLGKVDSEVIVSIPDNFDRDAVTSILHDSGLIKYKFLFNFFADFSKAEEKISAGTYVLNTNYDYRALISGMTRGGGVRVEKDITIPEGYTLYQIFNLMEANDICPAAELWEVATNYDFDGDYDDFLDTATIGQKYRLEGYLFPDTYTFYINDTPTRVIDKMLDDFDGRFNTELRNRAEALGLSMNSVLTIASMIEREAANDEERPYIASVIFNRLDSPEYFPFLGIDATLIYAAQRAGDGDSTEIDTNIDSPYNTYTHEGLPPGPIANPGLASIRAVLYPEDTDYYFYALGKDGVHHFFEYSDDFDYFVNESGEYGG